MDWGPVDTWIVVAGTLAGIACALVGSFLVLRGTSLMGDALSHTALPGIAIAFLLAGSRDPLPLMLGALVLGVVTAALVELLQRVGGLDSGASIGLVFTTLFALGLVLIRDAAHKVDLDPDCVLFGSVELIPLDLQPLLGFEIPTAVLTLSAALILDLLFVLLFFKELRITSFDPDHARALGIPTHLVRNLLMVMVSLTVVAAFEAVGSILVVAMLIVPAAAAHLLTDRLVPLLGIAATLAAVAALAGHVGAVIIPGAFGLREVSSAGSMVLASGLLFTLALLLGPRHGLLGRLIVRRITGFPTHLHEQSGLQRQRE